MRGLPSVWGLILQLAGEVGADERVAVELVVLGIVGLSEQVVVVAQRGDGAVAKRWSLCLR